MQVMQVHDVAGVPLRHPGARGAGHQDWVSGLRNKLPFYLHSWCFVQEKFGSEMVHFVRWYLWICQYQYQFQHFASTASGVTWPRWRTWSPSTTRQKSTSRTRSCSKIRLRTRSHGRFSIRLLFLLKKIQKACFDFFCQTDGHMMLPCKERHMGQ